MNSIRTTLRLPLLLLISLTTVEAAEKPKFTPPAFSSPPPGMGEAQLVGDILVLSYDVPKIVCGIRVATRKVGDREEQYTYTVSRTVTEPREEAVAPQDYRVVDMQGNLVAPAVLAQRLSEATPVLVAAFGLRIDPQYLTLYRPDVLIVYLRPERPRPPSPASAPAPKALPAPAPQPVPAPVTPGAST